MPELYDATDLDYNADSRAILMQVEIYFDPTPLIVTRDNYLIDCEVMEETGSDSINNPIGDSSANEFSFALLNDEGIFSPSNAAGPYFGKIKSGVKVIPYIRTKNTNWIQMGVFYVNEWNAAATGLQANVFCYDDLNKVFTGKAARPVMIPNITYTQAYEQFIDSLSLMASVDQTLTDPLTWWYAAQQNRDTLQQLSTAAHAACFCSREGEILIRNMATTKTLRATITDQDQLISADITSALSKEFDGTVIILNSHQLTAMLEILSVKDLTIPMGLYESPVTQFNIVPVVRVEMAKLEYTSINKSFVSFLATPYDLTYAINNTSSAPANVNLTFHGRSIEISKSEYFRSGENPLSIDNVYVQTPAAASKLQAMFTQYTNSDLPFLDISIRGNPLFQLGDKITVQSTKYNINFTGYILRQQFTYTGALRAQVRLIASHILEVAG